MKNKILFLIFVAFSLIMNLNIINAITCKTITPTAANATDLSILEGSGNWYGAGADMYAGSSDPAITHWRGLLSLNTTINETTGGRTIPEGVTISNMTFNFTVSEWKGGCAVFENVSIYAVGVAIDEAHTGANFTDINMTGFDGERNLISNYYNMPTATGQSFLYGINLTYAQNYTDRTLGKWGEGLIFMNNPCEAGDTINKFSSHATNDHATAAYHWSVTFCWGAGPTAPDKQEFTITAKDSYDLISINNITISITNGSNIFNFSTVN